MQSHMPTGPPSVLTSQMQKLCKINILTISGLKIMALSIFIYVTLQLVSQTVLISMYQGDTHNADIRDAFPQ